jgi:hypothetical protein
MNLGRLWWSLEPLAFSGDKKWCVWMNMQQSTGVGSGPEGFRETLGPQGAPEIWS